MMARGRGIVRLLMVAAALATAMPAGPVFAQGADGGTLAKIKVSKTLTIGYRESSPPFSYLGLDKRPAGYSIDLCLQVATAVQKALGLSDLKLSWVPLTPETRIEAVKRGTVDIECGSTTASLGRQEQVDFSLMTFVDGGGLLVTKDSNLRGLADLSGSADAAEQRSRLASGHSLPGLEHAPGRSQHAVHAAGRSPPPSPRRASGRRSRPPRRRHRRRS